MYRSDHIKWADSEVRILPVAVVKPGTSHYCVSCANQMNLEMVVLLCLRSEVHGDGDGDI